MEGGGVLRIVAVVTKKEKTVNTKIRDILMNFFLITLKNFSKENLTTILKNDEITLPLQSITTTGYDLF